MSEETKKNIEKLIDDNKVMLFMKGSANMPRCGFSNKVVGILNSYGVAFGHCDILQDQKIWDGIKKFSDWPTIPQLYINKEFIGGCDIVTQMHEDGSLATKLSK